jgi:2-polyprenyl-6-methoxyphenol hydroxylase-like FAD-dependent oxidoreductase
MVAEHSSDSGLDVLIVGAGPTGLTLAAQLRDFGVRFRIVDRGLDRARESRALAVQARSLEILQRFDVAPALVTRGNPSATLVLHFEGRTGAEVNLGGFAAADTRFPFILFVSQAETEAVLGEHLRSRGVMIERGVELIDAVAGPEGVDCRLRHGDGTNESARVTYLVGCDGAHSTVRKLAGIAFEGDAYLQDFMLGDVEVDGPLERNRLHSFAGRGSVAMFFPLGSPATWRVIAMESDSRRSARLLRASSGDLARTELSLAELQAAVDDATVGGLALRDPVWLTHFRLHHRQARRYRAGRVFLAGDAAHIHSPVGAQGMNTGIQDAWNLGWKLALVVFGAARGALLDTYEAERWPVGRALLRYTDRLFGTFTRAMSASPAATWFRRTVVARILPRVFRSPRLRTLAFRFVSELGIRYRKSPASTEGRPRLRSGPRAGDRLPDARVSRAGRNAYLHDELPTARYCLLLCGPLESWEPSTLEALAAKYAGVLTVEFLTLENRPEALLDVDGEALGRLGVSGVHEPIAQYLVRPDGYIAFRCARGDLSGVDAYLAAWVATGASRCQPGEGT